MQVARGDVDFAAITDDAEVAQVRPQPWSMRSGLLFRGSLLLRVIVAANRLLSVQRNPTARKSRTRFISNVPQGLKRLRF
jgi:hypothetical protein